MCAWASLVGESFPTQHTVEADAEPISMCYQSCPAEGVLPGTKFSYNHAILLALSSGQGESLFFCHDINIAAIADTAAEDHRVTCM